MKDIQFQSHKVLIIVPTLVEREAYLVECLDSLVSQTCIPHVIVAYPLRSKVAIENFEERYPTVKFQQIEGSQIEVINSIAFQNSHYKYMNWLGDDDRLPKESIERSVTILDKFPRIRGTFGGVVYIDELGKKIGKYLPPRHAQQLIGVIPAAIKLESGLFLTQDFITIGGIDPSFKLAPDVFITIKLRTLGRWYRIKSNLCEFRIHPRSTTAANRVAGLKEATRIQMSLGSTLEKILNIFLRFPLYVLKIVVFSIMLARNKVS